MVEEGSGMERLGQFSVEECGVQTNMTILVQNHNTLPVLAFFFILESFSKMQLLFTWVGDTGCIVLVCCSLLKAAQDALKFYKA